MNYRHAFHAGNHADILKHVILARVVSYFTQKEKPFAVLDAHAGIGAYDLWGDEAEKTGEWQTGIARLDEAFSAEVEAILTPFREVVSVLNRDGKGRFYPGSPEIILHFLRGGDRLIANELHPEDAQILRQNYHGEQRLSIAVEDAGAALKRLLPFAERRGIVLIDPPYEVKDESERVARMFNHAVKRFPLGTFLIWYPVKTDAFVSDFLEGMKALGTANIMKAELRIKNTHERSGLSGSGMLIYNPPFSLEAELTTLMPALADRLGVEGLGRFELSWLTPKKA